MTKTGKTWVLPEKVQIPESIAQLFPNHPFLAQAVFSRGITDATKAAAFFDPGQYQPASPDSFADMAKAVERIKQAINRGERIGIWGDFDVDGQTSTALLVSCLKSLGADVDFHIPIRASESHGIKPDYLEYFLQKGIRLLISCDTGISAVEAVTAANAGGVDVIITDHHSLTGQLPPAFAIINPNLLPAHHPFSALSGVGAAFQLARALLDSKGNTQLADNLVDLVALGTVADLADLNAENRYLVQKGLLLLRENKRKGLQELLALAATDASQLTEEQISFVIAPRMNAIGRLGDANGMVEFLLTEDETRARELALELENLNFQRKMAVDSVFKGAIRQLQNNAEWMDQPVLVLADSHWEAGVNGIVASRLVNQLSKPALIITKETYGTAHGSARSVAGVDIIQLISGQKNLLLSFGGHPMAAGFALKTEQLDQFRDRINIDYQNTYGKFQLQNELGIDAFYPFSSIDEYLAEDIEKLAPFGPGNPRIVLASHHVKILKYSAIGKNKEHLKISVQDSSGTSQELIWWQGEETFLPDSAFDLAYSIRSHNFQGRKTAQLEWLDWRETTREEISITTTSSKILDYRTFSLEQIQSNLSSIQDKNSIIWVEGIICEGANTRNRIQLSNADLFVILSIPPAKSILQNALEMVKPKEVWLGGVNPGMDEMVVFLTRLAGLLKHTLNQKEGILDLDTLAAMTSQTTDSVLLGTQLLAARGVITLEDTTERTIKIGKGGRRDKPKEQQLFEKLSEVLEESAAFRRFYLAADASQLLT